MFNAGSVKFSGLDGQVILAGVGNSAGLGWGVARPCDSGRGSYMPEYRTEITISSPIPINLSVVPSSQSSPPIDKVADTRWRLE